MGFQNAYAVGLTSPPETIDELCRRRKPLCGIMVSATLRDFAAFDRGLFPSC
jgi:hypothetical protein